MSDSQPVYDRTFKKKSRTSAGDSPGLNTWDYQVFKDSLLEHKLRNLESVGFNLRQCKRSEIEWFYFKVKALIAHGTDVSVLDFDGVEEKFEALRITNSQRR